MRTTDPEPQPFQPLGEKVDRTPPDLTPEWKPRPGSPGIYENREGRVRTDMPLPMVPPKSFP
jgi:hypothetical protein